MQDGQAEAENILSGSTLRLSSLVPLLEKLGDALVDERSKIHIPGNLASERWRNLQEYAANVHELELSTPEERIGDSVYIQWARYQGRDVLFKELKKLHLTDTTPKSSCSSFDITLVLSPHLASLDLVEPSQDIQMQLSFFLSHYTLSNLTHLSIRGFTASTRLLLAIPQTCQLLDTLELCDVAGQLSHRHIQPLMSLPFLQRFKMVANPRNLKYECEAVGEEVHDAPPQQKLHPLSIEIAAAANLTVDVLGAALHHGCNLQTFRLSLMFFDDRGVDGQLAEVLVKCPKDLRKMSMGASTSSCRVNFSDALTSTAIMKFHSLRKISFPLNSFLGEKPGTRLALFLPQWAHLKELSLPSSTIYTTRVPFSSLLSIAQACPKLQTLRILLEPLKESSILPTDFGECILSHPLRTLTIGSPAEGSGFILPSPSQEQAFALARYLFALFPQIEQLRSITDPGYHRRLFEPVVESYMLLKRACNDVYKTYEQKAREIDDRRSSSLSS